MGLWVHGSMGLKDYGNMDYGKRLRTMGNGTIGP